MHGVRIVLEGLRHSGYEPALALRRVGIDPATVADPDSRLPGPTVKALWDQAIELTGDPDFGLHAAEQSSTWSQGVFDCVLSVSPTVGAAFERAVQYFRLLNEDAFLSLDIGADEGVLRHQFRIPVRVPRAVEECTLAKLVLHCMRGTGGVFRARRIDFRHDRPADTSEHARIFATEVRFSQPETCLNVDCAMLEVPMRQADPSLLAVLNHYAERLLENLARETTLRGRVQGAIAQHWSMGQPTAEAVARSLAMSTSTLHRRLKEQGLGYKQVLNEFRCELAKQHLMDNRCSMAEIAFLLGFSEASAFHRAFRRWTGMTPAAFRSGLSRSPA